MMDKISISRWSNSIGTEGVEISIRNDKHDLIYTGSMAFDGFARAVTGQSGIFIERDDRYKLKFGAEQDGGAE